jgi:hypothetical protein
MALFISRSALPAVLLAALAGPAIAQTAPPSPAPPARDLAPAPAAAPAWPEALKKRNARYAVLTRTDDPDGDARERLVAASDTSRIDDPIGDREIERQVRADRHVPPRATQFARVDRDVDDPGDEQQIVVSHYAGARQYAETRRFRDLGGDQRELVLYRVDRLQGHFDDGPKLAEDREREVRGRYLISHDDHVRTDAQNETVGDVERRNEAEQEHQADAALQRGEALQDYINEMRAAREAARQEATQDAHGDAATERTDEQAQNRADARADARTEARADARTDARLEGSAERQAERQDENAADRLADRQLEHEENRTPGAGN